MTTDNFCFYLQNRLVHTSQTGGQWYRDTSPFSIPWLNLLLQEGAISVIGAGAVRCGGHSNLLLSRKKV